MQLCFRKLRTLVGHPYSLEHRARCLHARFFSQSFADVDRRLRREFLFAGGDIDTAVANALQHFGTDDAKLRAIFTAMSSQSYMQITQGDDWVSGSPGSDAVLPPVKLEQMTQPGAFVKIAGLTDQNVTDIYQGKYDQLLWRMCGPTPESNIQVVPGDDTGNPRLHSSTDGAEFARCFYVGLSEGSKSALKLEAFVFGGVRNAFVPIALARKALLVNFEKGELYTSPTQTKEIVLYGSGVATWRMFDDMTVQEIAKLSNHECLAKFPKDSGSVYYSA